MASLTDKFGKDPGSWPLVPKLGICAVLAVVIVAATWAIYVREEDTAFEEAKKLEAERLLPEFTKKAVEANQLEDLRLRKIEAEVLLRGLERQLPNDADIKQVLSDVSDLGLNRGLKFELFKKLPEVSRDNFVEQPIDIVVSGNYHDLAKFVSDVANLPRIVTLNDIKIEPQKSNGTIKSDLLTLTAVAKIFRYPTEDERAKLTTQKANERLANTKQ